MPNPDFGHIPACSCGNRKPQHAECVDCERQFCEQCAELVDGALVCRECRERAAKEYLESLPVCPNCDQHAEFSEHETGFTETHGLDCGPYETWTEHWLKCSKCGAKTDQRELDAVNA